MKNINEEFGKEFSKLMKDGNDSWHDLCKQVKFLNDLPELLDLEVCKQLENAHLDIYKSAIEVAEVALQSSRLYRDLCIINESFTEDSEDSK
jgi:hypothetical protein